MRFGVLDIENNKDGRVTEIGACLDEGNPIIWFDGNAWDDWYCWAVDTGVTRWYAHNGGGWDWLSLIYHSYYDPGGWMFHHPVSANCVGTRPIKIDFEKLQLCDSWCLTQTSLDKFSQAMGTHPKQKLDKMPWQLSRKARVEYLIDDCLALRDALKKFIGLLIDEGYESKSAPLTIASVAWNVWKNNYAPSTYEQLSHEADLFTRQGYKGGRVEVFKAGNHSNVNVYDVNSMYPYVMLDEEYPIGQPINVSSMVDLPGAYRIERCYDPANVMQFEVMEGDVLFSPEIQRIKSLGGEVEVYSGMVWEKTYPLFNNYVKRFYELKCQGGVMGFIGKMMLNHLYGKFGSRPVSASMESMDDDRLAKLMSKGYQISPLTVASDQADWWVVERPTPWRREHVGTAGLVTSHARCHLHRLIDENTIYSDTDSIHTTGEMDCSDKLGGVKLEYGPADGVYLGRKCYALKDIKTKDEKIRLKGISQKTLTKRFAYNDVLKCIHNPKKLISIRPATLKETLTGIHPCSMVSVKKGGRGRERKRTLRVTSQKDM